MASPEGGGAVRGASLLIVLQVGSRALTFVANQVLLRFLTAQLLGVSAQLEVYYLSVLFFARESLRVAIQRQAEPSSPDNNKSSPAKAKAKTSSSRSRAAQSAVNAAHLALPLGLAVAFFLGQLYLASVRASPAVADTPYLRPAMYLYALAAAVELLSEPAFVVLQLRLHFGARAAAEAVATLLRCAVTLGATAWATSTAGVDLGVLPFALGQLAYGVGLLAVYGYHGLRLARSDGFKLLPARLEAPPASSSAAKAVAGFFDSAVLNLAASMMAQSVVKHLLTQGDTFLVSVLSTPAAQGVYALVNNYGGLLARLVFQPVEESSRSYFSRLLSPSSPSSSRDPPPAAASQAARDLQSILRVYTLFSAVVVALGPAAAPLLAMVTGPRWRGSGASETLDAYVWYIPLLAINGVAEAFVASVASEAEVHRQSAWMAVFSVVFACAGFVSLRVLDMGARGLVAANCINMACRIFWCGVFIARYFRRLKVPFMVDYLRPWSAAVLVAAVAVTRQVVAGMASSVPPERFGDQVFALAKMAVGALPLIFYLAFSERQFLRESYRSVRGRKAAKSKAG